MLKRFWRLVEATVPHAIRRGPDVERRAQARLIGAISIIITVLAVISAPLDFLANPISLLVDLAIAAFGVGLVALQWRGGGVRVASLVLIVALGFLGVGLTVLVREPGDSNLGWIVVMGLVPMLSRSLVLTGGATLVVLALAFGVATSRPDAPALVPFGEAFPLVAAAWFATYCVFYTHRRAHAEHLAALREQRALEALVAAETRQLADEARETADFLTRVSHELRTPLNGVLGLADLLAHEELGDGTQVELARIRAAGRSVLRAFDTLLHLVRATAAGGEPLEECDLPGVLDACRYQVTHALGCPPERIALDLDPTAPRVVHVGQAVLRDALDQLLRSLIEGGAEDVRLAATWSDSELRVVVRCRLDAPPELAEQRDPAPIALGLPLAAELLATSGGTFDRRGGTGEDTTIDISLPCGGVDPLEVTAPHADARRRRPSALEPAAAPLAPP